MVHILAASWLHHVVNRLPYLCEKQFLGALTSVSGFSFKKTELRTQEIFLRRAPEIKESFGSLARSDK